MPSVLHAAQPHTRKVGRFVGSSESSRKGEKVKGAGLVRLERYQPETLLLLIREKEKKN